MSLPEYIGIVWKQNISVGVTEGNTKQVVFCHHVMQSSGISSYINFKAWVCSFMLFIFKLLLIFFSSFPFYVSFQSNKGWLEEGRLKKVKCPH